MKFYDISWTIEEGMQVYPKNSRVKISSVSKASKTSTALSKIEFGSHTGTHCDAPRHIRKSGKPIDKISLDHFYGKCRVIDLSTIPFGGCIEPEHISRFKFKASDIVLFKTRNSYISKWRADYVYLSQSAARLLAKAQVKTVCVDYLSIQKFHTGYCAAHCTLLNQNCIIVEGVRLKKVPPGRYIFCGTPLKIKGGDGAPMRAFLIK